jgi:DNA polymerase III epsilon subunit-like protein
MIVVDVETSGTEPEVHSLLSIGAINFNDPKDQFYEECRMFDGAHSDPEGLKINGFTEEQIRDPKKQSEAELITRFLAWIESKEEYTIGGQNSHVDLSFLKAAAHRTHANFILAKRVIDLHSIVYFHMLSRGLPLPKLHKHSGINSAFITKYVGIPEERKPHIGINGATWEAEALHRLFFGKFLFDQYKGYPVPFN